MQPTSIHNKNFTYSATPIHTNLNTQAAQAESNSADQPRSNQDYLPDNIPLDRSNISAIHYFTANTTQIYTPPKNQLEIENPTKIFDHDEFENALLILSAKYNQKVRSISDLTEETSDMSKFSYLQEGRQAREFLEERVGAGNTSALYLIQTLLDYSSKPGFCRNMRAEARTAYNKGDHERALKITEKFTEVLMLLRANGFGIEDAPIFRGQLSHSHLKEGEIFHDPAPMSFSISKDKALSFALWDEEDNCSIGDEEEIGSITDEEMGSVKNEENICTEQPSIMYVFGARTANISHFNEQLETEDVELVTEVSITNDKAIKARAAVESIWMEAVATGIYNIKDEVISKYNEISTIKKYFNIEKASDSSRPAISTELAIALDAEHIAGLELKTKASDPDTLTALSYSELEALSMPGDTYRVMYKAYEKFDTPKNKIQGIYHVIAERIE